jgi:hypothetical protein
MDPEEVLHHKLGHFLGRGKFGERDEMSNL